MIMTERTARTPDGMKLMIELAETLQAPVSNSERMDFPNRHPLAGTGGAGYRAGRGDQPRSERCFEYGASGAGAQREDDQHFLDRPCRTRANIQEFGQYPEVDLDIGADAEATLPALIEAVQEADHAGSQAGDAGARREDRGGAQRGSGERISNWLGGLGCEPGEPERGCARSCGRRSRTGLVAGFVAGIHQRLAGTAVEFRQALSIHRRAGRGRHGLWRAGGGGRGAGQQEARPVQCFDSNRWRFELRSGRVVDGGASSNSVVDDHAQQPRLSPGSDVHRAGGEHPQPRRGSGSHRARSSGIPISITRRWRRLMGWKGSGRLPIRRIWRRRSKRRSSGEEGRAGA